MEETTMIRRLIDAIERSVSRMDRKLNSWNSKVISNPLKDWGKFYPLLRFYYVLLQSYSSYSNQKYMLQLL